MARASLPVSHLIFADDSLFFCKVNLQECQSILRALKNYELASSQQINFSKSSVQFGQLVVDSTRKDIMEELRISTLGGMGTYLGIPESMGGAKIKTIHFIRERLEYRINGWTNFIF